MQNERLHPSSQTSTRLIVGMKLVFGLFLCYHTMAISLVLLPRESAIYQSLKDNIKPYLTATGNRQYWSMFTTKPYKASHNIKLEITDANGDGLKTGVLLPELGPYDQTYFRYQTIFGRMQNKGYKKYFHAYVNNVKQKLEEARGIPIKTIRVISSHEVLQNLKTIRKTGHIGKPEQKTYGVYTWD